MNRSKVGQAAHVSVLRALLVTRNWLARADGRYAGRVRADRMMEDASSEKARIPIQEGDRLLQSCGGA